MRLWIIGAPGSGKSTLARSLAKAMHLPAHHLDDLFWQPNWVITETETFVSRTRSLADEEAWIIDGNYTDTAPLLTQRATAALWLDLPFRVTYLRVLKRTLRRFVSQEQVCNGNQERLRNIFSMDGMPAYSLLKHRRNHKRYVQLFETFPGRKIRLTNHTEAFEDAIRFLMECGNCDPTSHERRCCC